MITPARIARSIPVMVLLMVVMLAGFDNAEAQGRFGFFGGLNIANMGGDMDDLGKALAEGLEDVTGTRWTVSKGGSTGLGFGAYYFAPMSPTLGIQIEGQYIRRGVMFDLKSTGVSAEMAFKLDYFELPILLRLSPGPDNDLRPVLLVGPVIGFSTTADLEVKVGGTSASEDVGDLFKSTNFGALVGAGFSVRMNEKTTFLLQARYYMGLSNALDDSDVASKSGDFGFFAGMEFGI